MVKVSGWQSFDSQFEPYLLAYKVGVAWAAVPILMTEYIIQGFCLLAIIQEIENQKNVLAMLASFQPVDGGLRTHVICVVEKAGSNPEPWDTEPSALRTPLGAWWEIENI